ncbi:MAG: HD domain-containing protein [Candidatus Marinimicrobia bacterium]|nr:HD domain-containing protein [Candidatus Neomarinimicrobiota bacterium]
MKSFQLSSEILASKSKDELIDIIRIIQDRVNVFVSVGTSLSTEKNQDVLLENIVTYAKKLTGADAATLYMMSEDEKKLRFSIVHTDSMNIRMGGTSGNPIDWYPVKLYNEDGSPYLEMVAAYVALKKETLNFEDVYDVKDFNFTGTRQFDRKTGYRTQSMLALPMLNHVNEVIGVLQLINAKDESGNTIAFCPEFQALTEALASQAAVAITENRLINGLEELLNSIIRVIASAIDEKSKYTSGHIERVAKLAVYLAQQISESRDGVYKDVRYSDEKIEEIRFAGLLHDIGKITTPEYVVDKSTKLETIYDRIRTIFLRFELLKKDREIEMWKALAGTPQDDSSRAERENLMKELEEEIRKISEDYAFIQRMNTGGEFLKPEYKNRICDIARYTVTIDGKSTPILTDDEILNLHISKGTLTEEERQIINNHAVVTDKMLSQLPFPKKLKNVPEYAANHHERMDGSGYPKGLKAEDLELPARIMAMADIFEALTAPDRPYKKGKTLSEAMKIMEFMVKDYHIDPDLFAFFKEAKVYRWYAEKFMNPEQIDMD